MTDKDDARGLLLEAINCMDAAISMASENGNTFLAGERIKLKARITAHLAAPAPEPDGFLHDETKNALARCQQIVYEKDAELAAIRSQPVPVEPHVFINDDIGYVLHSDYVVLQSALKVVQQERDKYMFLSKMRPLRDASEYERAEQAEAALKVAQQEADKNPCCCVPDSDNGEIAHLCKWHQDMLGGALKIQRMADTLTVENVLKLPDEVRRRFIAHGIAESTARKQAEARNKRLVELLKRFDALFNDEGELVEQYQDQLSIALEQSAELLREVEK